jgi:DNA-binding MarR family transcriptional regulator
MAMAMGSVYLAERRVRLFKRHDRPSRFWQAAFRLSGRGRPLVKSTGQSDLPAAKRWALDLLAALSDPGQPHPASLIGLTREDLLAPYPFPHIRQKKRHVEREIALRTLSAYRNNPLIAQRSLAGALNVSLAIVNAYTTRSVRAGWLLKLDRPDGRGRGYRYVLTASGERQLLELLGAYLTQELSLFRALAADFRNLLAASGARPIILQGNGDLAAIARMVLGEAGRTPLPDPGADNTARRKDAVLWLTDPAQAAFPPGVAILLPALLRDFAPRVKTKTIV